MYFRSSTRRRFPLQFDLIVINGGTDEIFQSTLINLIALEKIDRSPRIAFEARVEELVRIWEARPVGKGKLHLVFVGVGDRDYSVVRPRWASHPLPFLDSALHNSINSQCARNLRHRLFRVLKLRDGGLGNHLGYAKFGEVGGHSIGHSVGKEAVRRATSEISERQDGDRPDR